jgi:putative two-component system protein, hydrogenase maturation factor HypX/HoxX
MRILLISTAFSGLTQRYYTELFDAGYQVSVELHRGDERALTKGVRLFKPDLIICPFLTRKIPQIIYNHYTCLIVHPGIKGDRGPSSLDWAIHNGESEWGVTMLQAAEEMDAGDIWASRTFPMRAATKSSLFNREVTQAAVDCLWEALTYFEVPGFQPEPLDYANPEVKGRLRPRMAQDDRAIDWGTHTSAEIVARIRAADGSPGVLDHIYGIPVHLYNARPEAKLTGTPGQIIATANGAVCRATVDGAVWVGHLKPAGDKPIKLPATEVLRDLLPPSVPAIPIDYTKPGRQLPVQEVWFNIEGDVAYLHFSFHNGGMSTAQCRLMLDIYKHIAKLPAKAIVLISTDDCWSNGIHLNHIEHAMNPARESWNNINAIDDLIHQIITTGDKLTVAAVNGNAGAGGAMMALAADLILARRGVVFNPHYKNMGGLFGSEYWTYLLPKRVGAEMASRLTEERLPISATRACRIGFVDNVLDHDPDIFGAQVHHLVNLAVQNSEALLDCLTKKAVQRWSDETRKPLAVYRKHELAEMHNNFFVAPDYHQARQQFVFKVPATDTPHHLALHRQRTLAFSRWFKGRGESPLQRQMRYKTDRVGEQVGKL